MKSAVESVRLEGGHERIQRSMHAYATDLRSLTGGRGEHSEKFAHYEEMPRDIEQKIIAEPKDGRPIY